MNREREREYTLNAGTQNAFDWTKMKFHQEVVA